MRPFIVHADSLQLGLADVGELAPVVERLGFERKGMLFVRSFPGDALYARQAAERFEHCAEAMVRQLAGLERVPWEDELESISDRLEGCTIVGSVARGLRGEAVSPHDIDLVSDAATCDALAAALADQLVEPLVDGGWIGGRWFRAFAGVRIECVGDFAGAIVDRRTVHWRGRELNVGRIA